MKTRQQGPPAVILAGGQGTRLRAAIGETPKPLANVQDRPFMAHQLDLLRANGFTRALLCVGRQHEQIRAQIGDGGRWGLEIAYSVEDSPLGTGGALWQARSQLDACFVVLNGDTYFAADLSALIEHHKAGAAPATMALVKVADTGRYGAVAMDSAGYVTRFSEKGTHGPGLINAGVYVFELAVFDFFPRRTPLSLEKNVFPRLVTRQTLRGCFLPGYHIDIGTPESYRQFQEDVLGWADPARRSENNALGCSQ